MKNFRKRFTAWLLIFTLVFCMMPVNVWADEIAGDDSSYSESSADTSESADTGADVADSDETSSEGTDESAADVDSESNVDSEADVDDESNVDSEADVDDESNVDDEADVDDESNVDSEADVDDESNVDDEADVDDESNVGDNNNVNTDDAEADKTDEVDTDIVVDEDKVIDEDESDAVTPDKDKTEEEVADDVVKNPEENLDGVVIAPEQKEPEQTQTPEQKLPEVNLTPDLKLPELDKLVEQPLVPEKVACSGDENCLAEEHNEGCPKFAPQLPIVPVLLPEVQAFLDAVAQLPESVTLENADEVLALVEACWEAYEVVPAEFYEQEAFVAALTKLQSLMEAAALLVEAQCVAKIGEVEYSTITEAVAAAEPGVVIELQQDVSESVKVDKSLTIDLAGHTWTVESGNIVATSGEIDLTLQNGTMSGNGTNLIRAYNKGVKLTLDQIIFDGSKFEYILYTTANTVNISNCKFINNTADNNILRFMNGVQELTLNNVELRDNTATSSSVSDSGTIYINSSFLTNVTFENVNAINNVSKGNGGVVFFGSSCENADISFIDCELFGNVAEKVGGGICAYEAKSILISNTQITGNTANGNCNTSGSLQTGQKTGAAGGLHVTGTEAKITIENSKIFKNISTIAANEYCADICLVGTTKTTSKKKPSSFVQATLIMDDSSSKFGDSGYIYTMEEKNGGWFCTKQGSYFHYNPVGYRNVENESAKVYWGSVHAGSDSAIVKSDLTEAIEAARANATDSSKVVLYVCEMAELTQEVADVLNESDITFARCETHHDGYMFTVSSDVTLDGAIIDGRNVESDSSMILVSGGLLTITGDTELKNANTTADGGAVKVAGGSVNMTGGSIVGNHAHAGGAIYGKNAVVAFDGGRIVNNNAGDGGGVYLKDSESSFGLNGGRTVFQNNQAQAQGGALKLDGGDKHRIEKATFTGNNAGLNGSGYYYYGGAIYIQSATTVHMKNVFLSGNTSSKSNSPILESGALACCPTGDMVIYELDGILAVNNHKQADIVVSSINGNGQVSANPLIYISDKAPGGGDITYLRGGQEVDIADYQYQYHNSLALTAQVSDEALRLAKDVAEADGVVITDNNSYQFGSGIMTNGTLIIGTETKAVRVNKIWADNKDHSQDQVLVYLTCDGKIVDADTRKDASVILNAENNWGHIWSNLDNVHEWSFVEASVPGYQFQLSEERQSDAFAEVEADQFYERDLTNTPDGANESRKLVISKSAAFGLAEDLTYTFNVKLNNLPEGTAYALNLNGKLIPIYNNEVNVTLKVGEFAEIAGLPVGFGYEVTELAGNYHAYKSTTDEDETITVNFVNSALVDVSVEKLWFDTDDSLVRPASITINLMDGDAVVASAEVSQDENGLWSHTFSNLPKYDANGRAINYTVQEVEIAGYAPSYELNAEGKWLITNKLKRGGLTITKQIAGEAVEAQTKEYSFNIAGPETVNGVYKAGSGEVTFNKGQAEVSITGNGSVTIEGLPEGAYTVTEKQDDVAIQGYRWSVSDNGSVTADVANGGYGQVIITNTYTPEKPEIKTGDLTITKQIVGGGDLAAAKEYHFTVTGPNDYQQKVSITGAGSVTLSELQPGTYNVTEENAAIDGYTWSVEGNGNVLVIAEKNAEITITNSYQQIEPKKGSLSVAKKVVVDGGDLTDVDTSTDFNFTIKLSDSTVDGVYGDITFVAGVAEITLHHGERKTAVGLPAGVDYTVTEKETADYIVDAVEKTGVITEDGAEVEFTNTRTVTPPTPPTPPTPVIPENPENPGNDDPGSDDSGDDDPIEPFIPTIPLDQPPVPLTETPVEELILDEDVPLSGLPEEEEVLLDEEVPLAKVPKTGDNLVLWFFAALASGLAALGLSRKRG